MANPAELMLCWWAFVSVGAWQSPAPRLRSVAVQSSYYGDWQPVAGGSYVLSEHEGPVVHFIGGAFVGAASQLTYRYLLERLARRATVIATPYRLSFDYTSVCDAIDASFQEALDGLDSPPSEILCVGHSCGALLQALLATRDKSRKRHAFLSYNNKGVADAVPLFNELVIPLATEAMRDDSPAPLVRQALAAARGAASDAVDVAESISLQSLPPQLADIATRELLPIAKQSLQLADQLPELLREVADGARDFEPNPRAVRDLLRRDFRTNDALIVQFANDAIDESDDLYAILRDANREAATVEAPPAAADEEGTTDGDDEEPANVLPTNNQLEFRRLDGTHLTPLTQDIFLPATTVAGLANADNIADPLVAPPREQWLGQVDVLAGVLEDWLFTTPPLEDA